MKSLIRSMVVAVVVAANALCVPSLAQAGPTYAQRQIQQSRVDAARGNRQMEIRHNRERQELVDVFGAMRKPNQPVPSPAPVRQDTYETSPNQPGSYQPAMPTNDPQSDAQYVNGLRQTLATYSQLLEFCRANPGTTPEEQAATASLVQTILQSQANILRSLQNLESQGR